MTPALPALLAVACLALAVRGVVLVRDRGPIDRFESFDDGALGAGPGAERRPGVVTRFFEAAADRLAPRALRLIGPRRAREIRRRLDVAGRPGGLTVEAYIGRKAALVIGMGGTGLLLVLSGRLLFGVGLMAGGVVWMDAWLSGTGRRRQARIDLDLPDFLDVLAVNVSAGVGFQNGLRRVAVAVGGPLGEEVLATLRQMELGAPRREAFEALRGRNDSEDLSKFVTALLQAEELGVPLADVLIDIAKDMRRSAYQKARRRAQRAAPRVSLVVTTLIVPASVILIVVGLFLGSKFDAGSFLGG
jgi:tight adherence protein C